MRESVLRRMLTAEEVAEKDDVVIEIVFTDFLEKSLTFFTVVVVGGKDGVDDGGKVC